ncbi:thioredoxin fold domain-containing protein [Ideonella sp.]|uniref:thioredoxin fold domain-containing protein n=1 Tax=Ideonella sp. TaxID=1929293 RepID=UPI003BB56602
MNRRHFTLKTAATLCAGALAACTDQPAVAAAPSATRVSAQQAYEMAAKGHGFVTGPVMAANTVYVFFDTTCPHCAHLWESAKPLQGQLKIVWMPLAYLRPQSLTQGATILSAADPAAAMAENETRLLARQGGITASTSLSDEVLGKVKSNTALFEQLGVDSVPLIVWRNRKTGEFGSQTGAADTATLQRMVGL